MVQTVLYILAPLAKCATPQDSSERMSHPYANGANSMQCSCIIILPNLPLPVHLMNSSLSWQVDHFGTVQRLSRLQVEANRIFSHDQPEIVRACSHKVPEGGLNLHGSSTSTLRLSSSGRGENCNAAFRRGWVSPSRKHGRSGACHESSRSHSSFNLKVSQLHMVCLRSEYRLGSVLGSCTAT